jgi:hypothetical protein
MVVANYLSACLIFCLKKEEVDAMLAAVEQEMKVLDPEFEISKFIEDIYPLGLVGLPHFKEQKP